MTRELEEEFRRLLTGGAESDEAVESDDPVAEFHRLMEEETPQVKLPPEAEANIPTPKTPVQNFVENAKRLIAEDAIRRRESPIKETALDLFLGPLSVFRKPVVKEAITDPLLAGLEKGGAGFEVIPETALSLVQGIGRAENAAKTGGMGAATGEVLGGLMEPTASYLSSALKGQLGGLIPGEPEEEVRFRAKGKPQGADLIARRIEEVWGLPEGGADDLGKAAMTIASIWGLPGMIGATLKAPAAAEKALGPTLRNILNDVKYGRAVDAFLKGAPEVQWMPELREAAEKFGRTARAAEGQAAAKELTAKHELDDIFMGIGKRTIAEAEEAVVGERLGELSTKAGVDRAIAARKAEVHSLIEEEIAKVAAEPPLPIAAETRAFQPDLSPRGLPETGSRMARRQENADLAALLEETAAKFDESVEVAVKADAPRRARIFGDAVQQTLKAIHKIKNERQARIQRMVRGKEPGTEPMPESAPRAPEEPDLMMEGPPRPVPPPAEPSVPIPPPSPKPTVEVPAAPASAKTPKDFRRFVEEKLGIPWRKIDWKVQDATALRAEYNRLYRPVPEPKAKPPVEEGGKAFMRTEEPGELLWPRKGQAGITAEDLLGIGEEPKAYAAPSATAPAPSVASQFQPTPGKVRSLRDMIRDVRRHFGIPVEKFGKGERKALPKNVLAFYEGKGERIGVRGGNDLPSVAHEIGHHLEKTLFRPAAAPGRLTGEAFKQHQSFLDSLAVGLTPGPGETQTANGFGEAIRHYALSSDIFNKSPGGKAFLKFLETELPARAPTTWDFINELRAGYARVKTAPPGVRIAADIVYKTEGPSWKLGDAADAVAEAGRSLYAGLIEHLHPVARMETEARGVASWRNIPKEKSITALADFMRYGGNENTHWMKVGAVDYATRRPLPGVKPLEEIYDLARSHSELDTYAVAKRDIELAAKRDILPQGTRSLDDSKAFVTEIEAAAPETVAAHAELQKFNQALLKYIYDSGNLTPEAYARIKTLNENYIPFRRYFEDIASGKRGRFALHEIEGSERAIVNPVKTLAENTFSAIRAGDEQRILKAMYRLTQETEGTAKWIQVAETMDEANKTVALGSEAADSGFVRVMMNNLGKAESGLPRQAVLRIDRSIWEAIQGYRGEPGKLMRGYMAAGKLMRALAVEHLPAAVWLGFKDIQASRVFSTAQRGLRFRDALKNYWKGLTESYGHKRAWSEALLDRALMEGYQAEESIGKAARLSKELGRNRKSSWNRFTTAVSRTVGPEISRAFEASSRVGEHAALVERGGGQAGMSLGKRMAAGEAARDVAVSFRRGGSNAAVRLWRQLNPFWGARVQALATEVRMLLRHPARTAMMVTSGVVPASVGFWLLNRKDPRYKALPQFKKDVAWWINLGPNVPLFPFPKIPGLGMIVASGVERMLNAWFEDEPEQSTAFGDTVWQEFFGLVTPTEPIMRGALEVATGRKADDLRQDVVPPSLSRRPPELQQYPYGSRTAKGMSDVLGELGPEMHERLNPIQVERLVRTFGATPGEALVGAVDTGLGALAPGGAEPPAKRWYEEIPFVSKRLAKPSYTSTELVSRFERRMEPLTKLWSARNESEEFRKRHIEELRQYQAWKPYADKLDELQKRAREVNVSPRIDAETKRRLLEKLSFEMDEIARKALKLR